MFSVNDNKFGSEGAQYFADMLKVNTALVSVRQAAQSAQSAPLVPFAHSCEQFTPPVPLGSHRQYPLDNTP